MLFENWSQFFLRKPSLVLLKIVSALLQILLERKNKVEVISRLFQGYCSTSFLQEFIQNKISPKGIDRNFR